MSWCIGIFWWCWAAAAQAREPVSWGGFLKNPLVQEWTFIKNEPDLKPDSALSQAWWVLVLRRQVYLAFYSPASAVSPDQEGAFRQFREDATQLLAGLQPEVQAIQGALAARAVKLEDVKDPAEILSPLAEKERKRQLAARPPKSEKKTEKPAPVLREKPVAAPPVLSATAAVADEIDLDSPAKDAKLPEINVQGYRSVRYRAMKVDGSQSQFEAQNGLALLADKVEQRTDITVSTPPDADTQVEGRFYEFPNQEQELDMHVKHGPLALQGGIFNANFQTGTWAVMSKKIQGLQANYTRPNWGLGFITSQEKSVDQSETFQGNNSRGPYRLQKFPIVEGTLVVRLNGQTLAPSQYTVDYFLGQITFREVLDPNDLVELFYEEELLFNTSGQDSNGMQAFYARGPLRLDMGRLSQKAGAASAATGLKTTSYECTVGDTPGSCAITADLPYCREQVCLDLPHDLLQKNTVKVSVDEGEGFQEVDFGVVPYRFNLTERGYAYGFLEFDGANLFKVKKIKVDYGYFPPTASTTLTQDYYQNQITIGAPERLNAPIYAGSEVVYRCQDDGLGNCINPVELLADYDIFPQVPQPVDYQVIEANQALLLVRDPFSTGQTFVRVIFRTLPAGVGTGGKRFEKQITDMVLSYKPSEKFNASYERAQSTSDIGRKPLKVVNERINISLTSTQVQEESLTCPGGTTCASVNPNWDNTQAVDVFLITANKVRQNVCLTQSPTQDDPCEVIVDYTGGVVTFRNPVPQGSQVTASYFYFPCKGKVCRLSRGGIVEGSVSVFFDDVLNESNKLSALDFSVRTDEGMLLFAKDIPATVQTVIVNYDFNLSGNFNTIQDGEASSLTMDYNHGPLKAKYEAFTKDTVFAGFGVENNLDTLRRNIEASYQISPLLGFAASRRSIETALDIQKLNVKDQEETAYDLTFRSLKGLEASVGLYDRTLQDDLPTRLSDEKTSQVRFNAKFPLGARYSLSGGLQNEDFENFTSTGLKRQTTNMKLGAEAKPNEDLTLVARLEENEIETLSPALSYTSTNSMVQYQLDYRAFDRLSLGVDLDTQDTQDSRPGQPAQSQNTIHYSLQADPFWKVKNFGLEMSQQDTPGTLGGKTRTDTSNANFLFDMGKKWESSLTWLSTELDAGSSASSQQNQVFGLKYVGLGRLKGSLQYELTDRNSHSPTSATTTSGNKYALRLFYLHNEKTNLAVQYDMDQTGSTDNSTLLLDMLYRKSENNRFKYSFNHFSTGSDITRYVFEINWFKKLTRALELNTQARYADSQSDKMPKNDNKGFLLSTELKANFK